MNTPLEVTFQGVEKSASIEAQIQEKIAKLEKHFDRMTHARIVIAAPHRHSQKGKIYQIKVELGIPDHAPIIVTHEPDVSQVHEDLAMALREVFDAARRRLDDTVGRMSHTAKNERGRRRPSPVKS